MDHEVKGTLIRTNMDFLVREFGRSALERTLAVLPSADARRLTDVIASEWLPEGLYQDFSSAFCSILFQDDRTKILAHAMRGTEHGLRGPFKMVAWFLSPEFLLKQFPRLWTLSRRGPTEIITHIESRRSHVRIARYPFMERLHNECTFQAFIHTTLINTGARNPQIGFRAISREAIDIDVRWE